MIKFFVKIYFDYINSFKMNFNTFWISTTPRTGSMWLFNVTREILKAYNFNVLPKEIPQYDKETVKIYEKYSLKDHNENNKYVLKLHKLLPKDLKNSKILTTIRDPRDVCISFKEFMNVDFNAALTATKTINDYAKTYKQYSDEYVKFIKYENIENRSIETLTEIVTFIDINIDLQLLRKISNKFSRYSVRNLIQENDTKLLNKIKNKEKVLKKEVVYFSNKNFRSYDPNTGFQSGHISNRKSGDWKNKFSENEIKIINNEFKEILEEYNYEI